MGAIEVGRTRDGFAVRVIGRGTMRESVAVQEFCQHALSSGSPCTVDLQRCDALDSTFLGSLLILHRLGAGGRFRVALDDERAQALLAPCRLDRVLAQTQERPEMVEGPAAVPAAVLDSREVGRFIIECHRMLAESGAPGSEALVGVADRIEQELRR